MRLTGLADSQPIFFKTTFNQSAAFLNGVLVTGIKIDRIKIYR